MKKYKVLRNYTDKVTGESRWAGMEVELPDERAKTLKAGGFIEPAEKTTKKK